MPSTVVAAMHYDPQKQFLHIVYVSGKVYVYKGVPPEVYDQMKRAPSKGTFLNDRIKGNYDFEKEKD